VIIYQENGSKYILGCKLSKANAIFLFIGFMLCAVIYMAASSKRFEIDWNLTESLPQKFFVVDNKKTPKKGDYAAFNYYTTAGLSQWDIERGFLDERGRRFTFIKKIVGAEGDVVSVKGREVFINNKLVGRAKTNATADNRELYPIKELGVIPKGKYYFKAPHQDSYDSRYSEIGLVDKSEVRGKAYGFF